MPPKRPCLGRKSRSAKRKHTAQLAESDQQRQSRLLADAERQRKARAAESDQQRQSRRLANAERQREVRARRFRYKRLPKTKKTFFPWAIDRVCKLVFNIPQYVES